jgi:hypothetical protein
MAALSHLPTILDDTKTVRSFGARGDNMIPSVIYMATSGMGDARGTTEGTQKALSWRTVLICTGEQKITSFDKSAGTVARVLSLWGSPFGGYSDDAMAISDACDEHYGHAGRAFLEWVINETKADENVAIQWREQCKTIRAELLAKMIEYGNDKGVTQRLAAPLAAIEMTARLVHRALNLPWKYISPIEKLYPNMAKESSSAQRHEEAYGHMISWINSNRSKIENHAMSADHEPHGGWIGIYIRDSSRLAINKDQLDKFLRQNRFEPLSTYRMWRETNMIVTDKNKTTIKIHSGDYEGERMVCLRVTPEIESIFNPSTGESNASETHHSEPNRHHEPADQDDQETLW